MKKFVATVFAGIMLSLGLVAVAAPPASAACGSYAASTPTSIKAYRSDAGVNITTVKYNLVVWYEDCGSYARVTDLTYQVNPDINACGDFQSFTINPNVIGSWNPPAVTFACDGRDAYSTVRSNPYTGYVWSSDPANERCIAHTDTLAIGAGRLDKSVTSYSFCIA